MNTYTASIADSVAINNKKDVYNFPVNILNDKISRGPQRSTVIKYARIPDNDLHLCSVLKSSPVPQDSRPNHVRVRRVTTLEETSGPRSSRSLKKLEEYCRCRWCSLSPFTRRKIATILEDDCEHDILSAKKHHKKVGLTAVAATTARGSLTRTTTVDKSHVNNQNLSRLSSAKKCEKDVKTCAKFIPNRNNSDAPKINHKNRFPLSREHSFDEGSLQCSTRDRGITARSVASAASAFSSKNKVTKPNDIEKEISKIIVRKKSVDHPNQVLNLSKKNNIEKSITPLSKSPSKVKPKLDVQPKVNSFLKKKPSNSPIETKNVNSNRPRPTEKKISPLFKDQYDVRHYKSLSPIRSSSTLQKLEEDIGKQLDRLQVECYTETEPKPRTEHKDTNTDVIDAHPCERRETAVQADICSSQGLLVQDLSIPKLSLTKEKSVEISNERSFSVFESHSLPNLRIPIINIHPDLNIAPKNTDVCSKTLNKSSKSASFIISEATVTYTTKKKYNFHLVETKNEKSHDESLHSSSAPYPFAVMSVFKQELEERDEKNGNKVKQNHIRPALVDVHKIDAEILVTQKGFIPQIPSNFPFNKRNLIKPSDIISSLQANENIFECDYLSDQFQKELNFIDSFFESLQYLERTSVSEYVNKAHISLSEKNEESNGEPLFEQKEFTQLSKFNDDVLNTSEEMQTVASKSIFLLNLLIRDEHRRAKNLLFVLKMREDALKDFTKSQILWLENKKKQVNMDVSTLKKKQRGALLKLQHECGEMQRMRKALLTLSERRKAALMQTKKNIELKLSNTDVVDKILTNGKRRLKRSNMVANKESRKKCPLKCFDLSGSSYYCDESVESRDIIANKVHSFSDSTIVTTTSTLKSEKCVQTGDSIIDTLFTDPSLETSARYIKVDGGYLNILFHNLALPEIFSRGKEYEVDEQALKNVLNSANRLQTPAVGAYVNISGQNLKQDEVVKKLESSLDIPLNVKNIAEQFDSYIKDFDSFKETALSRIEEKFNNTSEVNYIDIIDCTNNAVAELQNVTTGSEDISELVKEAIPDKSATSEATDVNESFDAVPMLFTFENESSHSDSGDDTSNMEAVITQDNKSLMNETTEPASVLQADDELVLSNKTDASVITSTWCIKSSQSWTVTNEPEETSSICTGGSLSGSTLAPQSLSILATAEAEELRKKQLAIELEIKALEQQQSQLFIVREIPDKPPPPYTPPTADTPSTTQRDATTITTDFPKDKEKVKSMLNVFCSELLDPDTRPDGGRRVDGGDPFDDFLYDYCYESVRKFEEAKSDKPWDACNLLPQKMDSASDSLKRKISEEMEEVLGFKTVPPVVPCPHVQNKKADYIDDILFTEWRKCESEWTSLEADEVLVKNQVFESIFQKILDDTIEEYKTHVLTNNAETFTE